MSRDAYQVPTTAPTPGRDAFVGGMQVEGPAINYLCGDCNSKIPLKKGDPIRCKECGHRVLYKERTKRCVRKVISWDDGTGQ
jgi:DNA-directed RNA polymerase I, II, and III subunit RPABC4